MRILKGKATLIALGFIFAGAIAIPANADTYPSRAIKVIVSQEAGGTADIMARIVGVKLAQRLGQPVVIENRTGAGGIIAAELVAKASPDGYTLFLSTGAPLGIVPNIKKVDFDSLKSFSHIIMAATLPLVLTINNEIPARNVAEFIVYAKANPNSLNFASSGAGSVTQLSCELFKQMAGINMVHVPFKGSAASTAAVLGGQVQVACADSSILQYARSGQVRALAVTTSKRSEQAPDIPTMDEAGLKGYLAYAWLGFSAPAGTPQAIVDRLATEIKAVLAEPQTREGLLARGIEPAAMQGEEFRTFVGDELQKWKSLIDETGLKLD